LIGEYGAPLADGFVYDRTLLFSQTPLKDMVGGTADGVLPGHWNCIFAIFGKAAPKADGGELKEIVGRLTKELDQRRGIGRAAADLSSDALQKSLKRLVRRRGQTASRRKHRDGARGAQNFAEACGKVFAIHKCLNLMGNYLSSQFESREMGWQVPSYEIP
jgi:hypothetical protein